MCEFVEDIQLSFHTMPLQIASWLAVLPQIKRLKDSSVASFQYFIFSFNLSRL